MHSEEGIHETETVAAISPNENLLWRPQNIQDHQLEILRSQINQKHGLNLQNYKELHKWSTENFKEFWGYLWKHFGIKCSEEPSEVFCGDSMDQLPPKWFPGTKLNYAENLLRHTDDDKIAFYYTNERQLKDGCPVKSKTFGQLRQRVGALAHALRKLGIKKGDRVVGYIPNCPEAIEAMAATASLGAIWSSTSPDFGVNGVLDRFQQIQPRVIFSVDAVSYNLKTHDHLEKVKSVVWGLSNLEKVIIIPFMKKKKNIDISSIPNSTFYEDFLKVDQIPPSITYEQVPFDHPLFIMYSSGTTGPPKCIVHSVGGTLMKHLEEHQIQGNRTQEDVLFYYTTTGWMMWNWMVSALALGTSLVLYDGSPIYPHPNVLWDLVDSCSITIFGTSAKWIALAEDKGLKPRLTHKLTSLKTICSTGSPLKPHSFDYVYRDIKPNLLLASISGGTDIIACFMGENSVLPVYRGEIQSAHLGCALESWDSITEKEVEPGTPGELVVVKPFPSMPVGFWNDDSTHSLYRKAYFSKFNGVWAHEDFMVVNPSTGGILMLGRSDGTLNPNGVRFGSAEIYNIVETYPEVADSLCVGQKSALAGGDNERVILFLKMADDIAFEGGLVKKLKKKISEALSIRHVPALILPIADIPYTINGKKVEVAVKKILAGQEVKSTTALANPSSLELFKNIPETSNW